MDICEAATSVAWREQVMRTIALPSLASLRASSTEVARGSRSLRVISFQRSSLARLAGVEIAAMTIGRLRTDSPIVNSLSLFVSWASFSK